MKITIVLGAFLPVPPTMGGAVEKVWFTLAPLFVQRGHTVTMISRATGSRPREETIDGVRHIRVPGFDAPRSLPWLKFLDLIYSWRAKTALPEADILVTNTFWLPLLVRAARHGRVYVHVTRYPKGQMRLYNRAARLQAPSRAVAEAIVAEAPHLRDRVKVVPNPAPARVSPAEPPGVATRPKIMLYVGRIHPEKGVHLLVQALADNARTLFADWKLMIVGPAEERFGGGGAAYLRSLQGLAKTAGDRIAFPGPIFDARELEKTFQVARLFVYPSLAEFGESFGLAPLEAMTQRCAVLVSGLACFRDFVSEGETGFIFDHREKNDPASALGERIGQIVQDESLLERVSEAGYRKSAEYSLPRIADQFLDDFNSLL